MPEKKPRIILVGDEFSAMEVADRQVKSFVDSATLHESLEVMVSEFEPTDADILSNDDLGFIVANLTDDDAEELAKKEGVEAVEDDEIVYALSDVEEPFDELDDDLNTMFIEEDPEASQDIDDELSDYATASDEELDVVSAEDANFESQYEPDIDNLDIDESGELINLQEEAEQDAINAGVSKDTLFALLKCILQSREEGKTDVSDSEVQMVLKILNAPTSSAATKAARDYVTCGLRIIYAPYAWRYSRGRGARVAVVDTGITPRHPDLRVYGGASFVPGNRRWYDDHYHGTHVAGTIAAVSNQRGVVGVAPQAKLYAVKVLDKKGRGRTSWILNGLAWCIRARMHIVNLSLGSGTRTHRVNVYSRAYEAAGRRLRRRGILAIAAAGNSGRTRYPMVGNPARCPSFMAVSAVDCRKRRAVFSSYGPQVEITAPGVDVWSTTPTRHYRKLSGTSMASPHVAGVAALIKSRHPTWHGDTIRRHIIKTATDLGRPGRDWFYGYGLVNAYRAARY